MADKAPDSREHVRVRAQFRVRANALDKEASLPGVDVSRGGLFVRTSRFLPLGAVIKLTIEQREGSVSIPTLCRVVYVRDRGAAKATGKPAGMGLELLDIAEDKRPLLESMLQKAGAPAPAPAPAPARAAPARAPAAPAAPAPAPAPARAAPVQRSTGSFSVVVVDDDPNYRQLAAEPFIKRGDVVRTTTDGLEALSMCLKDPPDVILSDVQMPRMDGWQLLRVVRARPSLATVPVIFLTMLDDDQARLLGYQLGVDGYIAKPYTPEELLVRVHQIVRRTQKSRTSQLLRTMLRGELEHVAPQSLLAFLEVEKKTGILLLIGPDVARLFFRNGELLRAEIEGSDASPREALWTLLDWDSGQFEFAPQDVGGHNELGAPVTALLLQHAALKDEKKR